jgi:hypothetical protein
MKLFDIFKKESKPISLEIEEIESAIKSIKEAKPFIPESFANKKLEQFYQFGSSGTRGMPGTIGMPGERGKWEFGSSGTAGRTKKLPKDSIVVKINQLPAPQHQNLVFLGNSKIDGFPCFRYVGNDPSELTAYPYEELFL